jgi:hypothetical protein
MIQNTITAADYQRLAEARRFLYCDFTDEFMSSFDTKEAKGLAEMLKKNQYHREEDNV